MDNDNPTSHRIAVTYVWGGRRAFRMIARTVTYVWGGRRAFRMIPCSSPMSEGGQPLKWYHVRHLCLRREESLWNDTMFVTYVWGRRTFEMIPCSSPMSEEGGEPLKWYHVRHLCLREDNLWNDTMFGHQQSEINWCACMFATVKISVYIY